jgi:hypothetical protein
VQTFLRLDGVGVRECTPLSSREACALLLRSGRGAEGMAPTFKGLVAIRWDPCAVFLGIIGDMT